MNLEALSFRPYARLLTMLGDQLIKNERIALVELIKNAYDADADEVEVRFEDFEEDMTHNARSRIVVRDNGAGMTYETVRTQWMHPAAPQKYLDKRKGREKTPGKGTGHPGREGHRTLCGPEAGQGDHGHDAPACGRLRNGVDLGLFAVRSRFRVGRRPAEGDLPWTRSRSIARGPSRSGYRARCTGTVIEIENLKGVWK